jgi:hypothetical protein
MAIREHLLKVVEDTRPNILAIGSGNTAIDGQFYMATDGASFSELYFGQPDGSLSAVIPTDTSGLVATFDITDTVNTEAITDNHEIRFLAGDIFAATIANVGAGISSVTYDWDVSGLTGGEIPQYNNSSGNVEWATVSPGFITSVTDTTTVDLTVNSGALSAAVIISPDAGNLIQQGTGNNGLFVEPLTIASGSANFLTLSGRELSVSQLLITDVTVDGSAADIAAYVASNYTVGDEHQEGDVIILTTPNETWIHNGGSAGTVGDFTQVQHPNLSDAYIYGLFSSGNAGIVYDGSGTFTLTLDPAGANDLAINGNGLFLDVSAAEVLDTDNVLSGGAGAATTVQDLFDGITGGLGDYVQAFTVAGDTGATQTVNNTNNQLNIQGGGATLRTVASATNVITVEFDISTPPSTNAVPTYNGSSVVWQVPAGQTYTASNGIVLSSTDFRLGGSLTGDTTINMSTFDLNLNNGGNLTVGGTGGASKITAATGDIEVATVSSGFIVKSPNGTRHRITVSNDGELTTTSL